MVGRVLVVDDEPLARERVRRLVLRHAPGAAVHEAADGQSAVDLIRRTAPHAVFLDVEMPGSGGLDVVKSVGVDVMPPTIFVTAYDEYAVAAFDVAAVDYLLKPFDDARFAEAWTRLERRLVSGFLADEAKRLHALLGTLLDGKFSTLLYGKGAPGTTAVPVSANRSAESIGDSIRDGAWPAAVLSDRILVREGERTIVLALADVNWIEASGNHVLLHTAARIHRLRDTLANVESRLDPARFARIHRRFIVAVTALRELRPWSGGDQVIVLRDGAKLPVSRNYRQALASRLGTIR